MESYHLYTTFTVANELLRHAFGDCEIHIYFDFMAPSPPRQTGNVACPAQIATPRYGGFPPLGASFREGGRAKGVAVV